MTFVGKIAKSGLGLFLLNLLRAMELCFAGDDRRSDFSGKSGFVRVLRIAKK
jgi:hypothetical protein